ncbi:4'-phosphopantetheinyl transferase family protein [Chitinophaga qingshengii]|uniref:4-phosphopantetheinyl transferase family protein n=1 Tax=Chitinophaga qingshengii TaxID=1569794 RepID=A0ABR7TRX5_9BACT|nr:4'-phosphopantetheinyl transferase superfamily protein [Chitinophaga qingshengii]MBC9932216.1 4-phosphopantetheinyl transferase family protein [Chitinophaga qingshengii]
MIGNDVVDLSLAATESNWRRRGYLDKVFSPEEQQLIAEATDPDMMVWMLWSAKEAAYKMVHRATRRRTYAPQRYQVQLSGERKGLVQYDSQLFFFRTSVNDSLLHTVAVAGLQYWSKVVYGRQPEEVLLKDEQGIPFIRSGDRDWMASVSHHGIYQEIVSLKI